MSPCPPYDRRPWIRCLFTTYSSDNTQAAVSLAIYAVAPTALPLHWSTVTIFPFISSRETGCIHCSMTYDSRTGHTRHVSALTVAHA